MARSQDKVRIFSALEVANLCGVVNQTAINWIRSGYLKAFTTPGGQYRIYAEDLNAFLASRGMRSSSALLEEKRTELEWSTVLIVDDDRMLNDLLKRYFEKSHSSFTICQAHDGFEAGSIISDQKPGFIILDVDLPGVDGYHICHKIKTEPSFGKPFVVAITGLDEDSVKDRILAAGADVFMTKPLDMNAVVGVVSEFAGKVRKSDGKK